MLEFGEATESGLVLVCFGRQICMATTMRCGSLSPRSGFSVSILASKEQNRMHRGLFRPLQQ